MLASAHASPCYVSCVSLQVSPFVCLPVRLFPFPLRSFFSILFLRAAKLHAAFGGGSMTLLPLVPGRPASGTRASLDMGKYTTLSEEQKAKLAAVLEKRKVCARWRPRRCAQPATLRAPLVAAAALPACARRRCAAHVLAWLLPRACTRARAFFTPRSFTISACMTHSCLPA